MSLTGPGGLLAELTKRVVESALEGEMDGHLGYAKHDPAGRNGGNSRNGHRAKTVLTESGPVDIDVPRDRDSSFEPQIVRKPPAPPKPPTAVWINEPEEDTATTQ
jgi:putative transposase